MDAVIYSTLKNVVLPNGNYQGNRSNDLDQTLFDNTIVGKVSSVFGLTLIDLKASK